MNSVNLARTGVRRVAPRCAALRRRSSVLFFPYDTVPVKIDAYFFGISVTLSVVVRFSRSKRFSKALYFYFEELYVTTRLINK